MIQLILFIFFENKYKKFDVDLTTEDTILTLSICADNNKYTVVLHAKKIREI